MTEWHQIALGVSAGLLMGLFFFGGLWLTVRRVTAPCRRPMLLVLISFLIRGAVMALCFYALARWAGWVAILASLAGMMVVRGMLNHVTRPGSRRDALCLERMS